MIHTDWDGIVSPVGSPKLIAVAIADLNLHTELSIHLCTAVALHPFIINFNHQLIYTWLEEERRALAVHVDTLHHGEGRYIQRWLTKTVGHPNANYGACRIAIEGVHKQWKLTEWWHCNQKAMWKMARNKISLHGLDCGCRVNPFKAWILLKK